MWLGRDSQTVAWFCLRVSRGRFSLTDLARRAVTVSEIWPWMINSLAPGRSWCDFKSVIFNLALLIGIFKSSCDNVLRWMPQDFTDDKSTLVQVMAGCHQATSHYLDQCWPRSPTPYGVTRPQWVNSLRPSDAYICNGNLTIIVSDNGLSPGRRQAIIWTSAVILLIGTSGTNFSEILA